MFTPERRRLELDDSARIQMSIRRISEEELERVVNNADSELGVRRRGRPIEGRWKYTGSPSPGRRIEVECQIRADNGLYRVVAIQEL